MARVDDAVITEYYYPHGCRITAGIEEALAICIQHVTVTIGLLGSPVAVMTLPSELIQSTQKQLLEAQLALVAELQNLTQRAANGLTKGETEK